MRDKKKKHITHLKKTRKIKINEKLSKFTSNRSSSSGKRRKEEELIK